MTTLIVCIKRHPAMTLEQFSRYWRDTHGPLLLACNEFSRHIRSYVQYHMIDEGSAIAKMFGVSASYDGVAVITFKNADAMEAAFSEPRYLSDVRPDEPNFVDLENCLSFIANAHVVKAD